MDEKKDKRVLSIELDENVKKVSITGLGDDETVVMKQELDEDECHSRVRRICDIKKFAAASW